MPHPTRRLLGAAALAALPALALPGRPALAQAKPATPWPERTTRIVVPFPPADTTDILARILADRLGPRLGVAVVAENRAGAAGVIGSEAVVRAEPDGTTLLMTTIGTGAINYALYGKTLTFKPQDLVAVSNMAKLPNVIMVPASSPIRTLAEFVAAAKGGMIATGMTVGIVTLVTLGVAQMVDMPFGQIWLDLSPGALEGMGALGIALGYDTAFIAAHHVVRLLMLSLAIPVVVWLVKRRESRTTSGDARG